MGVEEVPEWLKTLIEAYRQARKPAIKIGLLRIKKVVGEIYGGEGEGQAQSR